MTQKRRYERGALCSVEGCLRRHHAYGFCANHAARFKRHGDPLKGGTTPGEPERFYEEVVLVYNGNDCLFWPFGRDTAGYAQLRVSGAAARVHVLVCEREHGPRPTADHEAAHSCGKGHLACVTKRHLDWKTHAENMADMSIHGTSTRGERCCQAKLTEQQVREIRQKARTMRHKDVAALYGITRSNVGAIVTRKSWAWLEAGE